MDISVDNVTFTELDEKGIYGEAFGDLTVKNSTFNGAGNDASGAGNPYTGRSAAAIDINQTVAGGSVSITGNLRRLRRQRLDLGRDQDQGTRYLRRAVLRPGRRLRGRA